MRATGVGAEMGRVKIKDAITKRVRTTVTVREPLYARKCDCCRKLFGMEAWCNDQNVAYMQATFDMAPGGEGNIFFATICSLACGDKLFNGKWKKIKKYQTYVKAGATLVRAECYVTLKKTVAELEEAWEKKYEGGGG